MEQVKSDLKALKLNPNNQKRKWAEQGAPNESVNQNLKKLAPAPRRVTQQVQQCLVENVGKVTTPLLIVEWGPTNICGVVVQSTLLLPMLKD